MQGGRVGGGGGWSEVVLHSCLDSPCRHRRKALENGHRLCVTSVPGVDVLHKSKDLTNPILCSPM